MKKLLLAIAAVAMLLPSCKKINEELDALDARLDKLEQETIPTIDEQISAINTTLGNLDAMDKELKGYIDGLQATADNLQEQINATNTKIDEVESALRKEIEDSNAENLTQLQTAKSEVLAQLATAKTELENELAQINATIATLQEKDKELDEKFKDLNDYVNNELTKTTTWVEATFATLEQYNSLVTEIAVIKEQIKATNQSIAALETYLTTKINADIAAAVASLSADIQQKVKEITDAYTDAIKSAKEEITAAYTSAIQTAITTLDNSLKTWVGEQLANYYTIAEIDAKIATLQYSINIKNGDEALAQVDDLRIRVQAMKIEITDAYKQSIADAINTNNGVIDTKIANEIATVNQRITSEVATINAKITEIENRLNSIEAKLEDLLARIQSISYIPTYEDGKATVKYADGVSSVTLDFEISPKDAVAELAKVWQQAISVKAIYTQTRAVSFVDMPIMGFEVDVTNGVISVTASGENLSEGFFNGTQTASVRLAVSDSNNSVTSEYVPLEIQTVMEYTTSDSEIVVPYNDYSVISNTYTNGVGKMVFRGRLARISEYFCKNCTTLTSVTIPASVEYIALNAFQGCSSLSAINMLSSTPPVLAASVFSSVAVNLRIYVPFVAISAYKSSKSWSTYKSKIYDPSSNTTTIVYSSSDGAIVTPNEYSVFGANIIDNTYTGGQGVITFDGDVTSIGGSAFEGCTTLTSIVIPNTVASIDYDAFMDCTNLTSVSVINCSVEYGAFQNCNNLKCVYFGENAIVKRGSFDYLSEIYFTCTTPPKVINWWDAEDLTFAIPYDDNTKIYVPESAIEVYKTTEYWKDLSDLYVAY